MNMGRQYNTDNEMHVLQAITWRIFGFSQVTSPDRVLEDLRQAARTETLFAGDTGKELFESLVDELEKQGYVRKETYKGEPKLGLETDIRFLETLDSDHLFN